MYAVFKDGRSSIRRTFATYEAARQAARKLCRKEPMWNFLRLNRNDNPPIGAFFGYSVRKIT